MNQAPASQPAAVATPAAAKKKSKKLWIILGGSALLLILILAAVAKSRSQETGIAVTTDKAVVRSITHIVTATGKVQPEVEVKISPEVGGEIVAIPFKEGNAVKQGDVLVKIKPDFYKAQAEQMEATLAGTKAAAVQAHAQLLKAQDDYKRSEDLYAKQLISDSDYTVAKTGLDVAQANYDNALAQIRSTDGLLNQARDQLSKTVIYAPMDGTISSLTSEIGERVIGGGQFAGTEIMRVADLSHMEVRVKVNENDIVNVAVGEHVVVTVDAFPNRKFDGSVREISSSALTTGATGSGTSSLAASASDEVTNFLVKISVVDRAGELRPGMSATADIETQTVNNVVAVPVQSVTVRAQGGKTTEQLQEQRAKEAKERSGNDLEVSTERAEARRTVNQLKRVVFIVHAGKVAMVNVDTGIADNTYIEVKSGVKAGDEVVSGSYAAISRTLKDGSKVKVEKPKKDDAK